MRDQHFFVRLQRLQGRHARGNVSICFVFFITFFLFISLFCLFSFSTFCAHSTARLALPLARQSNAVTHFPFAIRLPLSLSRANIKNDGKRRLNAFRNATSRQIYLYSAPDSRARFTEQRRVASRRDGTAPAVLIRRQTCVTNMCMFARGTHRVVSVAGRRTRRLT